MFFIGFVHVPGGLYMLRLCWNLSGYGCSLAQLRCPVACLARICDIEFDLSCFLLDLFMCPVACICFGFVGICPVMVVHWPNYDARWLAWLGFVRLNLIYHVFYWICSCARWLVYASALLEFVRLWLFIGPITMPGGLLGSDL